MEATVESTTVKPLLHRREVAALRLGISVRTLDELVATRQIRCVRIGGTTGSRKKRVLITEDALQDFIRKGEADSKRGR
jgi:hypothetical protein